ncbi:Ig-like domain-containing protein [Dehalobacterium formicoaceticum]|uniref:Ig-like domain-containing protein n=1 Tax=Dehalobacterium formicoaceticum TaxID=51515 RepID=A0ABT1Y584_9FIRM|nr:Ig-like domain-containing protein [Dehalobacterium formicoaceticum]MCR6545305.1 Ig-like domain-containing protein [Dehalobacterium formicoaceticum]
MNLQPRKIRRNSVIAATLVMIMCLCFAGMALADQENPIPILLSTNPVNGAADVDINAAITLTWDENIKLNPQYGDENAFFDLLTLKEKGSSAFIDITLTASGDQLIVTPDEPLKENTEYKMVIPDQLVETTGYVSVYRNIESYTLDFSTGTAVEAGQVELTVTPASVTLEAGTSSALNVDATEGATINYASNNTAIATVAGGVISGIAPGNTTVDVTATLGESTKTVTVEVTVTEESTDELRLTVTPLSVTLEEGSTKTLTVNATTGATIAYVSNNTAVATVANRVITGVASGSTTVDVTATLGESTKTVTVNVTVTEEVQPELQLTVTPLNVNMEQGTTRDLTVTATAGATITYASADEEVATVAGGVITGVAAGTTTVDVTASMTGYEPKTVTVNVAVTEEATNELQLTVTPATKTLYVGETGQSFALTVAVVPADAVLTYATSDAGVVTVTDGTLTAVAEGVATITVTASKEGYDDVAKTVEVTVESVITGDVNLDGEVDILDVQTAINIAIGRTTPSALQIEAGDLNDDGKVNILDVVKLINLTQAE